MRKCFLQLIMIFILTNYFSVYSVNPNLKWIKNNRIPLNYSTLITSNNSDYFALERTNMGNYYIFNKKTGKEYSRYYGKILFIDNNFLYYCNTKFERFNHNIPFKYEIGRINLDNGKDTKFYKDIKGKDNDYLLQMSISNSKNKVLIEDIYSFNIYDINNNVIEKEFKSSAVDDSGSYFLMNLKIINDDRYVACLIDKSTNQIFIGILDLKENKIQQKTQIPDYFGVSYSLLQTNDENYIIFKSNQESNFFRVYDIVANSCYECYLPKNSIINTIKLINGNTDEVIINTTIIPQIPDSSFIYNFKNRNTVFSTKFSLLNTEYQYELSIDGADTSFIVVETETDTLKNVSQVYLGSNNKIDYELFKNDTPEFINSEGQFYTFKDKFTYNNNIFSFETGNKERVTENTIIKFNQHQYAAYSGLSKQYKLYDISDDSESDGFDLPDNYRLKEKSKNTDFISAVNNSNKMLIKDIRTNDTFSIPNNIYTAMFDSASSGDYKFLNSDYLYYYGLYNDTIYLYRISTKTEMKIPFYYNYTFTADEDYIFYYDYIEQKFFRIQIDNQIKEEIELDCALKNVSLSYDGKYILGVTARNSITAYEINTYKKRFEVSYQNLAPSGYFLSDDNKYLVIYSDSYSALICFKFDEDAAIEEELKRNNYTEYPLYPNPASDMVNLNNKPDELLISVEIYNSNSEMIRQISDVNVSSIDISSLPAGAYYIKMNYDKYSITKQFVKR